jgi:hypothetical protein
MNKTQFKKFLYGICKDCDCHKHNGSPYCTLIEFLCSHSADPKLLMQLKCVEKLKWCEHKDLSWNDAFLLWIEKGYAKKFSETYDEDLTADEIFKKITE